MPVCWNVLELCRSASVVNIVRRECAFKRCQDSAVPVRVLFADDCPLSGQYAAVDPHYCN